MASSGIKWQSVLVRTDENVVRGGVVREGGPEKKTMPKVEAGKKNSVGIGALKWYGCAQMGSMCLESKAEWQHHAQRVDRYDWAQLDQTSSNRARWINQLYRRKPKASTIMLKG